MVIFTNIGTGMKVIIKDMEESDAACDVLIVFFCEGEREDGWKDLDSSLEGLMSAVIRSGEFGGKQGQLSLLHTMNMIKPARVLMVGLGKKIEVSSERLRQAGGRAVSYLCGLGFQDVCLSGASLLSLDLSPVPFVEGGLLSAYKFRKYKKDDGDSKEIKKFAVLGKHNADLADSLDWVVATTSAVNFAKDLVNTPANDMTPSVLAKTAKAIAGGKVSIKILERADAEKEGMGAFLSVARGSMEPPKFIVLKYEGGKGAPVALIGKSITFDSGGISIKPSEGMEKMKYDMAGGAVVLAVVRAASLMRLPVNLIGVLPAAENLPGGSASKPGDVITSLGGRTIEIISTDAEGRLVLADAMGYVKKFKPKVIIDVATLTGACSVALGNEAIAMMGNDRMLVERLKTAGDEVYERVWEMPLYDEYREYIKSDVAELKNSGGKTGSLVTAGYFLKEFAGDTPWVHLDIAGTAWAEKDKPYTVKGATGVGVRLILNFLKERK
jgi:leucyl aminopeptidase